MSSAHTPTRVEVADGVATVTLDQPARHNALTIAALAELEAALRSVGGRPDVRAVVLCGAGASFSTGMDLGDGLRREGASDAAASAFEAMRVATSVTVALREIPQPVVAAVRGHAVGAGFSMAAASDVRICAPDARFHAVFTSIGMSPGDIGLSWLLPRLIGFTHAAELFYTAGVLDAATAERLAFVSRVVEDPLAEARSLAATMAAAPPLGITMTKDLLNASLGWSGFREHLELELRSQVICSLSDDHAAALASFARSRAARRPGTAAPPPLSGPSGTSG